MTQSVILYLSMHEQQNQYIWPGTGNRERNVVQITRVTPCVNLRSRTKPEMHPKLEHEQDPRQEINPNHACDIICQPPLKYNRQCRKAATGGTSEDTNMFCYRFLHTHHDVRVESMASRRADAIKAVSSLLQATTCKYRPPPPTAKAPRPERA